MSDDTPTQRLPEAGGTPAAASPGAATDELAEERKKSRTLLVLLIALGGALLIAIIVLLIVLLTSTANSGSAPAATDSPSPTPAASDSPPAIPTPTESPEPTAEPTPTAAPPPPTPAPDTSPGFASFSATTPVQCQSPNEGVPVQPTPPQIRFSWTARNAQSVWFQYGTGDAAQSGAYEVPLSGNQNAINGVDQMPFPCPSAQENFTLTVVGTNGQHVHKHFTITNTGYQG